MAEIKEAKKKQIKSYVRYDIKYSLSISKKEYLDAVKDYNFTRLDECCRWKYLTKYTIIRTLINQLVFGIVIGVIYTIAYLFKQSSSADANIDEFLNIVKTVSSIGFFVIIAYTISSEFMKYGKLWKEAQSFDRETKNIKKFPKHMIVIEDDLVEVARIKFKKQKFVVETIKLKTWKIRGLIPYKKYGLKNFYLLTTTSQNLPIYIKSKHNAKKLGDIVNGWAN